MCPFSVATSHTVGDECLRKVAQTIKNSVDRSLDLVARYGGEEFVVTISAGVSVAIPDSSNSSLLLIQSADKMLYKAKDTGRNKVVSS